MLDRGAVLKLGCSAGSAVVLVRVAAAGGRSLCLVLGSVPGFQLALGSHWSQARPEFALVSSTIVGLRSYGQRAGAGSEPCFFAVFLGGVHWPPSLRSGMRRLPLHVMIRFCRV